MLGTITAVKPVSQDIVVKEDKSGTEFNVSLATTKTLLKVEPNAKNLSSASRIRYDDLAVGDRVDIRGFKDPDNPTNVTAASVILMSGRDLQQAHRIEAAEWQRALAGTVTFVDPARNKLEVKIRADEGPTSVVVDMRPGTRFTRYAPETPKTPVASQLSDIQPGDQIRVIGEKGTDQSSITAEKVYSGTFQTLSGTVLSVSPDARGITISDIRTKQPVRLTISDESALRKLPPELGALLARRLNPGTGSNPAERPHPNGSPSNSPGTAPGRPDISNIIERLPAISISDLKPGDAVIVSAAPSGDKSRLVATNVIAGVEPIFQSAPPRQGRSTGSDWALDMAVPQQ